MGFDQHLAIHIVSAADGTSRIELDIDERHLNRRGIVHGAVYCALMDDAIGAAVHSVLLPDGEAVTANLITYFVRPATQGKLVAEGRVIRRGRRLILGEASAYDEDGRLVATGSGSWAVVKPPSS